MTSILARRGLTYLVAVGILAALAIFVSHDQTHKRIAWDAPFSSFGSKAALTADDPYVNLEIDLKHTKYHGGVAGFNAFSNLYLHDGAYIIVTEDPDSFPHLGSIIRGLDFGAEDDEQPSPGPDRISIMTPAQAKKRMGDVAVRKPGLSMFFNDAPTKRNSSFLDHYYHSPLLRDRITVAANSLTVAEMFIGGWRAFTAGFPDPSGTYEMPKRIMYRTDPEDWRDTPRLITWLQQVMMPDCAIEDSWVWSDREYSQIPFFFEKITISDRASAHKMGTDPRWFNKSTGDLPRLKPLVNWMQPLRDRLKKLAIAAHCGVDRAKPGVPVVTYIDRQMGGRKFIKEDAENLSKAMWQLDKDGVIEFYDAVMEHIPGVEQICIALRTDIMIGIHGNGLTHQMWMKPGGVVMEMMDIGGMTLDYALPAQILGHDYFAIHNDTVFPEEKWYRPDGYGVSQSPGFHGDSINIHGPFVAGLVAEVAKSKTWPYES